MIADTATAILISKEYIFADVQLRSQEETGCETAITGHTKTTQSNPYTAILDLNAAYDSDLRDKLLALIDERLPKELANMLPNTLLPIEVYTKVDATQYTRQITRGVVQGSPLNPVLFNIYKNTLAEAYKTTEGTDNRETQANKNQAIALYSGDVKLQASNTHGLRNGLKNS